MNKIYFLYTNNQNSKSPKRKKEIERNRTNKYK